MFYCKALRHFELQNHASMGTVLEPPFQDTTCSKDPASERVHPKQTKPCMNVKKKF